MKNTKQESYFLVRHTISSPIGHVSQAGYLPDTRGVGHAEMRLLGEYAVVYLMDGQGAYRDGNGVDRAVGPGDLIFIFPDLAHAYGPGPDQDWTEMYLVFGGPVFELWDRMRLLDRARPVIHLQPLDYWAKRFDSVLGAPHRAGFSPPLLEACRLQEVLAEALVGASTGSTGLDSRDARWLERARVLLESDLARPRRVWEVAGQMAMPYERFRKRFTRMMGMPPGRYREKRVMDRACEMMQRGTLTNQQIALALGFCDEFYFSRRFKQVVGCAPSLFRQRLPQAVF